MGMSAAVNKLIVGGRPKIRLRSRQMRNVLDQSAQSKVKSSVDLRRPIRTRPLEGKRGCERRKESYTRASERCVRREVFATEFSYPARDDTTRPASAEEQIMTKC